MNVWIGWLLLAMNIVILPYFLYLYGDCDSRARFVEERPARGEPRSRFLIVDPGPRRGDRASRHGGELPGRGLSGVAVQRPGDRRQLLRPDGNGRRGCGARVVERFDAAKKSKGYAIEFLIGRLVESGEFEALDALVADRCRHDDRPGLAPPVRCRPPGGPGLDPVLLHGRQPRPELADATDDLCVQPVQRRHAAGPGGAGDERGPARQRDVLLDAGTAAQAVGRIRPGRGHGILLDAAARRREAIAFEPSACVYGAMLGSGGTAAANQRRRWEFGRGEIRRKYLGPLLRSRADRLVGEARLVLRDDHAHAWAYLLPVYLL